MKKLLFALLLAPAVAFGQALDEYPGNVIPLIDYASTAQSQKPGSQVKRAVRNVSSSSFDLQGVTVAEVIQMIYSNAIREPYVLSPDVLADDRPVSFRWSSGFGSLQGFLVRFLDSLGYKLERVGRVDFVGKYSGDDRYQEIYVYRPKYRSVKYLSDMISPMLDGKFNASHGFATEGVTQQDGKGEATLTNALGQMGRDSDTFVYRGEPENISKVKELLVSLDVPGTGVLVRGLVYEVGFSQSEGSVFSFITNLFGGSLTIGMNAASLAPGSDFISFKNVTIDLIANMLSKDSRFSMVSSPSLRVMSGKSGKFTVGQDVPILGSVTYPENSSPVQSIEYRSSGVIFNILPQVYGSTIDLDIQQQISNFVRTETGVDSSPTLMKREISTSVSLQEGEVVILGGLAETKDSNGRNGFSFLPNFLRANTKETSRSELILVLQATRIGRNVD
ncbi:hypothetical protein ABRY95_04770 [Castellaniella ginsengisoli]|uniref:Type II/III secretion system secretin-like domain-containing protein n=1 Tax=Castellaniella ginsengisoli TaxID=546114 RepID=A0AB39GN90_9BURK